MDENGNVVRQSGGFSPEHGILICANELRDRGHLEDTLAHEMVHAWDHLRWKVDWNDLRHAACSEVSLGGAWRSLGGKERGLMRNTDSCLKSQRRMQMDERVLHARKLDCHAATSDVRAESGDTLCDE